MENRNTRTTQESAQLGLGNADPSRSLINMPHQGEATTAPDSTLAGRVIHMEKQQAEILALLKNRGAAQSAVVPPAPVNQLPPPPVPAAENSQESFPEHPEGESASHSARLNEATKANQQQQRQQAGAPENPTGRLIREEIRKLMAEEYNQVGQHAAGLHRTVKTGSPLAPEVLMHPVPHRFKLPKIEAFDGTEDPSEHIHHFSDIMRLCNAPDQLLCQVFPTTLKGQARTWFCSLKEGRIDNFANLSQLFVDQFIANRRIVRDPSHLSGIRQSEGETLKEFFRRFTTEARQISGVDPELLRGFLLGGLLPGNFYSALMRETVPSYPDLIRRIEAQIAADEAIEAHRRQFEKKPKRQQEQESTPMPFPKKSDSREDSSRRVGGHHRHQTFTPLNASRTEVLLAIRDHPSLQRPRALAPSTGDQSKYCDYHQGHGHRTEDCSRLKTEIERLIRLGQLGNFLQNKGPNNLAGGQSPGRPF